MINRLSCAKLSSLLCVLVAVVPVPGQESSPGGVVRFTDVVKPAGGRNLVPNGSFEIGEIGWSSLGRGAGFENSWAPLVPNWGNFATLHGEVKDGAAADGRRFLRIPLGGRNTPVFNFDYFYPVNRRELRPLAASKGWIEVEPGKAYTLSVSLRASRPQMRAAIGVINEDAGGGWNLPHEILRQVEVGKEWKRYAHTFVPKHRFVFVVAGPDLENEEVVDVDVDAVQLERADTATEYAPRTKTEVGIETSSRAGVFTAGVDRAGLVIRAHNADTKSSRVRVLLHATDYADQPVPLSAVEFDVAPGKSETKNVRLPEEWHGFYRVRAEIRCNDVVEEKRLRVAIVPKQSSNSTVLGVNHAYPTAELVGLAKKAGVTWHRDWSLKWQHIEPAKGEYRWDVSDPQMHRVADQGLNLMAMIPFPSAEWNSEAPDLATIRKHSPRHGGGGQGDDQELLVRARWAWAPKDGSELKEFVGKAVARYRKEIDVWEFLNEAGYTTYSLPGEKLLKTDKLKSYTEEDYFSLLRETAPAIREANPNARIMGGGMFPGDTSAHVMIKHGLLDYIDILGTHDYPSANMRNGGKLRPPEDFLAGVDKLIQVMKEHGGVKPLWMTEFSYFGSDDLPRAPFIPIPGLWSEPQLLSEKQVGDFTVRYITMFLGRAGEKIFLHSGCTGSVNKPGTESCLFEDGAVRKAYAAVAVLTKMLGEEPRFVADKIGDAYAFAFENDSQTTVVLWDPAGKATVPLPGGVKCFDIMGRPLAGQSVKLSESPVYFVARKGDATRVLQLIGKL